MCGFVFFFDYWKRLLHNRQWCKDSQKDLERPSSATRVVWNRCQKFVFVISWGVSNLSFLKKKERDEKIVMYFEIWILPFKADNPLFIFVHSDKLKVLQVVIEAITFNVLGNISLILSKASDRTKSLLITENCFRVCEVIPFSQIRVNIIWAIGSGTLFKSTLSPLFCILDGKVHNKSTFSNVFVFTLLTSQSLFE